MTTLTEIAESDEGQAVMALQHCLIIGPTKTGKSDWVAQAAIDGYEVIYFDEDNGLITLLDATKNHIEARSRIHYFNPVNLANALEEFLTMPIFRYNVRTRSVPSFSDKLDDRIIEIYPSRLPRNLIFSLDSWSSFCYSAAKNRALELKVSLTDIDKYSREIYGAIGFFATQMATILQHAPFHVIVQAHGGYYERKEKPEGKAKDITEKDMLIRETTEIPMSTSAPHGFNLGKHFNQIGWTYVDRFDNRVLDFKAINGRIGGGTPGAIGDPRGAYRFATLFGKPGEYPPIENWKQVMTSEEMKARAQASSTMKFAGAGSTQVPKEPAQLEAPKPNIPKFMQKG